MSSGVEPVFFRHRDTGPEGDIYLRPYEVCTTVGRIVGASNVDGAQNVWGIWRIYLKNASARAKLLSSGLKLRHHDIQLFDKNPRTTGIFDTEKSVEKVIIKDLPLSLDNEEISKYLSQYEQLKLTSSIRYSRERNEDGELTSFRNGDRYVYAESPILPILPSVTAIANLKCRIYHPAQKMTCKICGMFGHKAKSNLCPAYSTDLGIVAFRSHEHPLSNFYPCTIVYRDEEYKSVEHAYQTAKAIHHGDLDLADAIRNAPNAFQAKKISKHLDSGNMITWENSNLEIMEELLRIKADSVPEFKDALQESAGYILAEATRDTFWASGLTPEMTEVTKPEHWPGKNALGAMMMKLRSDLFGPSPLSDASADMPAAESEKTESESLQKESEKTESETVQNEIQKVSNEKSAPVVAEKQKQSTMDRYTVNIADQATNKRRPSSSPILESKKESKINRTSTDERDAAKDNG